jgi:peptidyl-prolyl cis-trans isomerase SurA
MAKRSMKRSLYLLFILGVFTTVSFAQNTSIPLGEDKAVISQSNEKFPVFTYGKEVVYNDEFMRVFNKNNRSELPPTKQEIEEYLDLYVKFKLKVAEAYARQMDTVPSFKNELAGYRRQLARPYLTDKSVTEKLIKEAYDRGLQEVRASHLLISLPSDAKPKDTLEAYNKIMGLRSRVLENNESFSDLAEQYSQDPSAKENKGDLGYFTAFQMIYPFENAAYSTPVGSVSMPIRTQFGYHLVAVKDKRKSLGDVKVAHIMIKYYNENQIDSTKRRIDAVYTKLKEGGDWNTITEEFSEDFNSNSRGGELNWFNRTTSNIPNEFKDVAYALKEPGDYSKPVKTRFGWHIIKLVELRPPASFEASKEVLRRKVERDSRSLKNKQIVVKRVKEENGYEEVKGLAAVKDNFNEDLLKGSFKKPASEGLTLFKIGQKTYSDEDFYSYIATNAGRSNMTVENYVKQLYKDFVDQTNLDYEEQILEEKYDEFRYIMEEYRDGILLFELTDKEVWSKAVEDTTGLEKWYASNQDKYQWKERAVVKTISCSDAKTAKKVKKMYSKGIAENEILDKFNSKDALAVSVEKKTVERGKNEVLDKLNWEKGIYDIPSENDRVKFVSIEEIIPAGPKDLQENLGQATSDYQNYLEAEWIADLKQKYPVVIYTENVKKLYN